MTKRYIVYDFVALTVCFLLLVASARGLIRQKHAAPQNLSQWIYQVRISPDDSVPSVRVSVEIHAMRYGPLLIREYEFEQLYTTDPNGRHRGVSADPNLTEAFSAVLTFPNGMIPTREQRLLAESFPLNTAQTVASITIRPAYLWALLIGSGLAISGVILSLARTIRRSRRARLGLCTRCAYPLPLEDEQPRCPECGTLHIP